MWKNSNKANKLDTRLIVWSCTLPHAWPWHCSFTVKVSNRLIWGMGVLIDMERNRAESIIHDHDRDLWITMVGWVDVPYSDWGDFRRRRAVDISSYISNNDIHIPYCCRFMTRVWCHSDTLELVCNIHCVSSCICVLCCVICEFVFFLCYVGKTCLCLSYTNKILESWNVVGKMKDDKITSQYIQIGYLV